jgi:hypothetical protein
MVEWSAAALVDPLELLRGHTRRMQLAAGELRFEVAGKIKVLIDALAQLGKGAFRHVGLLRDFAYVSLQHGPREGTAKVFLITAGRIEEIAGLVGNIERPGEVLRRVLEAAEDRRRGEVNVTVDKTGAERVGIVTHHLFVAKGRGVFLRMENIDERSLVKASRDLSKQKQEDEVDDEGVVKELQAL